MSKCLLSGWKLRGLKEIAFPFPSIPVNRECCERKPRQKKSSFKAIYRYQTSKPCIFFEVKNLIFHPFSKIRKFNNPCDVIKSKLGQEGGQVCILYFNCDKKIKFNNYGFFEFNNSLWRPVF